MGKLMTMIKAIYGFISDKERMAKAKLTWAAISDCYKQMKSASDELKIKVDDIWK